MNDFNLREWKKTELLKMKELLQRDYNTIVKQLEECEYSRTTLLKEKSLCQQKLNEVMRVLRIDYEHM